MKKMYINRNNRRLYTGRRGIYRNKKTAKPAVIMLIAIIILIAAATYSIMNTVRNNNKYNEYMTFADTCYAEADYTQALTAYIYAESYGPSHNEAKMGRLNCYINTDIEDAVDYAREIVKSGTNEELFLQMAEAIDKCDSGSAYKLLEDYVADKKSIGENVQALVDSVNATPVKPVLSILPGTYVKLDSVRFELQEERFGNSIYYTYNAEVPNQYSKEYRGGFAVTETCDIRVRSFNAKGDGSETAVYSFIIDASMGEQLLKLIDFAKELRNSVNVGVSEGQCNQQSVDKLNKIIDEAEKLMAQDNVLFMDAENYVEYIQEAMTEFKNSINKNVLKSDISSLVQFGTQVYNAVNKSSISNDLVNELQQLNVALVDATQVYNANGTQKEINEAYYTLYQKLFDVNTSGWKSAYEKIVVENGADYLIYDINFDDIPELILQQEKVTLIYAYSVSNGKAVNVNMENKKYNMFFNHRDGLLSCVGNAETGEFKLMTYKDNKITLSDKLTQYNDNITLKTGLKALQFKKYSDYTK